MKIPNKLILSGLAAFMVGCFVYYHIYFHEKNREELKEIAREIALTWKQKLNLTLEQTSLLENIIIDYTIKKNKIINAQVPEPLKIKRLKRVQVKEHKDLRKILGEVEFNSYVGINKKIPNNIMDSLSAF